MSTRFVSLPKLYRLHPVELRRIEPDGAARADGDGAEEIYEIAISSESPVERSGWFGERWIEILLHSKAAVDMSRMKTGIAFLRDHDTTKVAGIIEGGRIDSDKILRGRTRFSVNPDAQELKRDIADRIRPYVSVGYIPRAAKKVEVDENGVETWHVTRWEPVEASSVAVPADITVGVGRAHLEFATRSSDVEMFEVEIEDDTSRREEGTMADVKKPVEGGTIVAPRDAQPERGGAPAPQPGNPAGDGAAGARAAAAEIIRMAEGHGMASKAGEWIERGLTPDQVAGEILKAKRSEVRGQPPAEALQLPEKDRSRYSYSRAILEGGLHEGGGYTGLEGEMHQELMNNPHIRAANHGGIQVPLRLHDPVKKRAMDTLTAGKGTELVYDRPGELIELLRAQSFVVERGARMLTGLKGPVTFPRQTSGLLMYWVGENPSTDVTASDIGWDEVKLAPKSMMGTTAYSRQLLVEAEVDSEMMVRDELGTAGGLGIDRGSMHAIGSAGEPTGIYAAPDVQAQAMGGVPTYAKLVDMIGLAADKNAARGKMGWLTTPLMAAVLMRTLQASAAGAAFIWTGTMENGIVAGYPAGATTQVSKTLGAGSNEHGMIFGNWADLLIGLWNSMEVVVDPYALKKRAMIEITAWQMGDVVLRHGESFVKATGATIA